MEGINQFELSARYHKQIYCKGSLVLSLNLFSFLNLETRISTSGFLYLEFCYTKNLFGIGEMPLFGFETE